MPQEKTPRVGAPAQGKGQTEVTSIADSASGGPSAHRLPGPDCASSHLHTSGCPRPTTLHLHGKRQTPTRLRTGGQPRGPWGHTAVGRDASGKPGA